MKRTWTILGVRDVPASYRWYQSLFGQPQTPPAHEYFGQILDADGTVLLCLHQRGAHEHPSLMSPEKAAAGEALVTQRDGEHGRRARRGRPRQKDGRVPFFGTRDPAMPTTRMRSVFSMSTSDSSATWPREVAQDIAADMGGWPGVDCRHHTDW